jgi:hypothetical protein
VPADHLGLLEAGTREVLEGPVRVVIAKRGARVDPPSQEAGIARTRAIEVQQVKPSPGSEHALQFPERRRLLTRRQVVEHE